MTSAVRRRRPEGAAGSARRLTPSEARRLEEGAHIFPTFYTLRRSRAFRRATRLRGKNLGKICALRGGSAVARKTPAASFGITKGALRLSDDHVHSVAGGARNPLLRAASPLPSAHGRPCRPFARPEGPSVPRGPCALRRLDGFAVSSPRTASGATCVAAKPPRYKMAGRGPAIHRTPLSADANSKSMNQPVQRDYFSCTVC